MVTKVAHRDVRSEPQSEAPETVRVSATSSTETVPSTEMMCGCSHLPPAPHRLEQDVCRCLATQPNVHISSLVVRRVPDGVCIEGVLENADSPPDVAALLRCIPGITEVVNHLVVRRPPPKG